MDLQEREAQMAKKLRDQPDQQGLSAAKEVQGSSAVMTQAKSASGTAAPRRATPAELLQAEVGNSFF